MASIERKINGTFAPVPGGYARQIDPQTTLFVPDFSAARYDPKTGELFGYAPDYAALEAEKDPRRTGRQARRICLLLRNAAGPHGL